LGEEALEKKPAVAGSAAIEAENELTKLPAVSSRRTAETKPRQRGKTEEVKNCRERGMRT
jgi:hypothetical protein